jgi:hypothetical protein
MIDHMVYTHTQLRLTSLLDPLTDCELAASFGAGPTHGLPDSVVPSDHLPIGAVYRLNLRGVAIAAAAAIAGTHGSEGGTGGGDGAADPAMVTEVRKLELRQQWQALVDRLPAPHKQAGKPPQEWIDASQLYSEAVRKWMAALPKVDHSFAKLLKKGSKTTK